MPLGWRKLPRSVVRWLFQDAPDPVRGVPDLLRVPSAAWWSVPLQASLQAANQKSWLLGPLAHVLVRKLGRHVLINYSDGHAPFRVPGELTRRWRIRTTPVHRGIRRWRRKVRARVRRRGQPGPSRGPS